MSRCVRLLSAVYTFPPTVFAQNRNLESRYMSPLLLLSCWYLPPNLLLQVLRWRLNSRQLRCRLRRPICLVLLWFLADGGHRTRRVKFRCAIVLWKCGLVGSW